MFLFDSSVGIIGIFQMFLWTKCLPVNALVFRFIKELRAEEMLCQQKPTSNCVRVDVFVRVRLNTRKYVLLNYFG